VPLEFLKRKGPAEVELAPAQVVPEDASAQEYILKLYYAGKSTEGVRLKAGPRALAELPSMLVGLAQSEIEVVEPLPIEYSEAAPTIIRSSEAMQWVNAHHGHGPITRHALFVLESLDAIDLAFDTLAVALLDGELDTSGYPDYSAVVGWGGRGVRGDTDRIGARALAGLFQNILANQYALGIAPPDRPVPAAGRGGLVCAHCGFSSAHERAFYCPKCGMRLLRG